MGIVAHHCCLSCRVVEDQKRKLRRRSRSRRELLPRRELLRRPLLRRRPPPRSLQPSKLLAARMSAGTPIELLYELGVVDAATAPDHFVETC